MQTWEYKVICESNHKSAETEMNKAGEEGWEAFAGAVKAINPKAGYHFIWFKRPKQA